MLIDFQMPVRSHPSLLPPLSQDCPLFTPSLTLVSLFSSLSPSFFPQGYGWTHMCGKVP
jgi:hypothetical protein